MQIQATTNLGTNDYDPELCLTDGEEREVPDHIGTLMVKRGHAIDLTPQPEPKRRAKVEAAPQIEPPKTTK